MLTMKKKLINDTLIQFNNMTEKSSSNDKIIECNVNMNVSIPSENKSRIFQIIQSSLIVILTITFLLAHSQLRGEIRILEAQINSINSNLAILVSENERLHKNLNRTNLQQQQLIMKLRKNNDKLPIHFKISSYEEADDVTLTKFNTDDNDAKVRDNINGRVIRSIVTFEGHNETENMSMLSDINDNDSEKDNSTIWTDSRVGRVRRDVGRGPLMATFVGGVPEQHITDTVYIGPWVKKNESRYGFNKFHLVEDKHSIEVTVNGLFMISTQIYYFGEPTHYSYWILLSSEGSSITRKIAKCATASAISATETSCYTNIVLPLRRGDRLHIQQQERDRLINLREGYSYIQITLLSGDQQKKRAATATIDRL